MMFEKIGKKKIKLLLKALPPKFPHLCLKFKKEKKIF